MWFVYKLYANVHFLQIQALRACSTKIFNSSAAQDEAHAELNSPRYQKVSEGDKSVGQWEHRKSTLR